MAFKVLIWNSSPTLSASADRTFWRFAQAFGANDVLLTNTVPALADTLTYKCFVLILPALPADMPPEWRKVAASTDAFLTQLREVPPHRIRVIPIVSDIRDVSRIAGWYPAFAGLASRQAAVLDEQDLDRHLDRLLAEVLAFQRSTPVRRAAAYTSVILAFGALAAGLLGEFEDFFATWDAADVVVEVLDKNTFRLSGRTYPRAALVQEVRHRTYRRRNSHRIILRFPEDLDFRELALVATELKADGHRRLAADVGGRFAVEIRFVSNDGVELAK